METYEKNYNQEWHKKYLKKALRVVTECSKAVKYEQRAIYILLIGLFSSMHPKSRMKRLMEKLQLDVSSGPADHPVFAGCGHILMDSVPGTAKTNLAENFSAAVDLDYSRIQFNPEVRPSDTVGCDIIAPGSSEFISCPGPVYTNFLLADEINRALEQALSALLEVAAEGKFRTIGPNQKTYIIKPPFFMVATENPLEQKGVINLPEAISDRFAMKTQMNKVNREQMAGIIKTVMNYDKEETEINQVLTREEIQKIRKFIHNCIYVDDLVIDYIAALTCGNNINDPVYKYVKELEERHNLGRLIDEEQQFRRAAIFLTATAKAMAFLKGRSYVTYTDVDNLLLDVLRVRMKLTGEYKALKDEGIEYWRWQETNDMFDKVVILRDKEPKPVTTADQLKDQLSLRMIRGARELCLAKK